MELSRQQALDCFRSDDLIGIGMEADAVRRRLHPEGVVSYRCLQQVDLPVRHSAVLAEANLGSAALRLNCASVGSLATVAEVCAESRKLYPARWIEVGLQAEAILDGSVQAAIPAWSDSGVNSVFADPRHETASYGAITAAALAIHRAAHASGMRTTVAIPFGSGESISERLDFLEAVRSLQDEIHGFVGFLTLGLDAPGGRQLDGATAVERLKMLAVARMFLQNIRHMQAVQVGSGLKVLQTGLRFGADDAELTLSHAGATEQDLRRVIRDAGFRPVERDGAYATMFLN